MSKATMGWPDRILRSTIVTTRKAHTCWVCANLIPVGSVVLSIAALDQQGGFTHGHRHDYECYTPGRY